MLPPAVGVYGTDCDVTGGSHPMIFLKKDSYSQELRVIRKIPQDQEQSGRKLVSQPVLRMC